jgi:predicted permease
VALSTVLLVAAGLLIRSLSEITAVDPGFEAEGRIAGTVQLPEADYDTDEAVIRFAERVVEAVANRPDVASAAAVTRMPFRSGTNSVRWWEDGQGDGAFRRNPPAELNSVTPEYFKTMGIELLRGRALVETDGGGSDEVAVISATFAREFFGMRDPLGARISFSPRPRFFTVVGVVEDTKHRGLGQEARFQLYVAFAQRPTTRMTIVAHGLGDAAAIGPGLRQTVRGLDPNLAISEMTLVEDAVSESVWRLRLLTGLFRMFGVFALLMAAVGIAGIVSQAVARRTREIGLRIALGAGAPQILTLVSRRVGRVVLAGLAAGAVGALALGRLAAGLLYGVDPGHPVTILGVVFGFGLVGIAAAWIPARRAIAVDPATALRLD